jgi:hypothetical protein
MAGAETAVCIFPSLIRHRRNALVLALVFLLPLRVRAESDPWSWATVIYAMSSTVYVDAGRDQGLREGVEMEVVRDGERVGGLVITAVSSRRAACQMKDGAIELVSGDRVRFHPVEAPVSSEIGASQVPVGTMRAGSSDRSMGGWLQRSGLRGRAGLRYSGLRNRSGVGGDFHQPAVDLRIDGTSFLVQYLDVSFDVRTRRTYRDRSGSSSNEGSTRVYRAFGTWARAGDRLQFTAGRQHAKSIASIGIYDGADGRYEGARWFLGAFAGYQPEPSSLAFSDEIHEFGVYMGWKSPPAASTRWRLNAGLVGSYDGGAINREYIALHAHVHDARFTGSILQEIDLNREWKAKEEAGLELTSTFVSLHYQAFERVRVDAGVDTRRNVRLYRDRLTPETEFDDSYRQGYWTGLRLRPLPPLHATLRLRRSTGGSSGTADAATATLRARWPSFLGLTLHARTTRYETPQTRGWLFAFGGGTGLRRGGSIDLTWGRRDETMRHTTANVNNADWYSLDLERRIAERWYALFSFERTTGEREENDQVYSSLVHRF